MTHHTINAICIIGSPCAHGSTMQVVEYIIAGMADAGIESQVYLLHDMHIGYCQGCKACTASAQCVQRDDMDILFAALLAADIVLLASPSYWGDVTAQLKTFIDRCTPLCDTRPGGTVVPPGKRGIAVALRAGQSQGENQHLLATMHHFFGHLGIMPVAELTLEGIHTPDDLLERQAQLQQAYEMGFRLQREEVSG